LPVTAVLAAPLGPGLTWIHGILRIAHANVTPWYESWPFA